LKVGCWSLGLPHTDFDVLEGIIGDGSAVSETIEQIFWHTVVWVDEPAAIRCKANLNARCAFPLSLLLSQWLMANSRLRLGMMYGTSKVVIPFGQGGILFQGPM
jgi:hypothetical protein